MCRRLAIARPTIKLKDIEASAIELFAQRRVNPVTIKDIARHANCAEGTLYRHYKSKDDMVWTLHQREVERFGSHLKTVLQTGEPILDRIRYGVGVFYSLLDEDPDTFTFILLSQHHFPPDQLLNPEFNPLNLVAIFVQEGVDAGSFNVDDVPLAASMVMGLVLEPAMMRVTGRLDGPMMPRVETVTAAVIHILGINQDQV